MKRLIVIYALLLAGLVNAQAIKYGVTGGVHRGSIPGIHGISKPAWGGNFGVYADISLVPNDIYDSAWLYFTPQVEMFSMGETGDWNEDKVNYQKYRNIYLGVPLYIKYYLKNHGYKGDIFFMLGPKFEFLVSEKTDEGTAVNDAKNAGLDPNKFGLGQRINTFGLGISGKVGVRVTDNVDVFIRFDRGISSVYPDYKQQTTYNRFLSLGFSYRLGETY